tara:strand:- start:6090 stop:6479 length:390 start_codon:yes stop_codon:yes gene_type:complete
LCDDDNYDFWFDLEEKFRIPRRQLEKILTHKEFLEQKMRFNREPWGSKAINGQNFIMLEMIRKIVATKYDGFGPEKISKFAYSKTSEIKDQIEDLRVDPDSNEFEFSPDSSEMLKYSTMFAGMEAKWGK